MENKFHMFRYVASIGTLVARHFIRMYSRLHPQ